MDYPAYDPASADHPLTDDELALLERTLEQLPGDGVMTLDGLDGFLTALAVGPGQLARRATADWLPVVWGGGPGSGTEAPFPSNQKRKRTVVLVLRHLRSVIAQLERDPALWEPVFSVAALPGDDGRELADAADWCRGFLAATDLDPAMWAPLFDDHETGPGLATIALLGEEGEGAAPPDDEEDLEDPMTRDRLSRLAADAALVLWARHRHRPAG